MRNAEWKMNMRGALRCGISRCYGNVEKLNYLCPGIGAEFDILTYFFHDEKVSKKSSRNEASALPARIISGAPFLPSRPATGIPSIAVPPPRLAPAPEEQAFIILN